MATFLPLLIFLLVLAALFHDDFSLTLIYLFLAVSALGTWWVRRSLSSVKHKREFNDHAFLDEQIDIHLHVRNPGLLPVLWMSVQDSLPVALSTSPFFQQVLSLGPRAKADFTYSVQANKRGYYPIGPLSINGGDILGVNDVLNFEDKPQYVTVYPKVIPFSTVQIPSRSPQGTLRHTQQIFEDTSRLFGKREYSPGDSLRRVDWKSSASSGHLQVKIFEPSIALETLIFLDLNSENYSYKHSIEATELAIVIAASLAAWVIGKQQTVGLKVHGQDIFTAEGIPQYLPPRKGQAHLMRMLENLARVSTVTGSAFTDVVRQQRHHLAWGTSLIVITGESEDALLDELYQARRAGQNVSLILTGPASLLSVQNISQRAAHFGIPVVSIQNERDLDIWRK